MRKLSQKHRANLAKAHLGKKHSQETIAKMRKSHKPFSAEVIEKRKGAGNSNWKGGIYPINLLIRSSKEYKDWRKSVFERDNYTCVECGGHGMTLNADHIKPFAYFPELRLVIENGRTLCVPCHKKTDTYAGRAKSNYKQSFK
jgi:hypothetical protein